MTKPLLVCAVLFGFSLEAACQEKKDMGNEAPGKAKPIQALPENLAEKAKSPEDFNKLMEATSYFGNAILIFGGVIIAVIMCLGWNGLLKEPSMVRLLSLVFLATLASFLIVGGFSPGQIGSAMTLLGTLAGYIFGRREDPQQPAAPPPTVTPAP